MTLEMPVFIAESSLDQLRAQLQGEAFLPADAGYDAARTPWNLVATQHPALVVMAEDAFDVAAAVRYARHQALGVAVTATGHNMVRAADDELLINMSRMKTVTVNAETRSAWVAGGAQWEEVIKAVTPLGLAPLLGSSPGVGVVGYTLGGGVGWLARKYGISADSVRAFEVVTAEGNLIRVSRMDNPDLFWALRGGGGSFGVVTAVEIVLYPVPTIYGGNLLYPVEMAKEVFMHYRAWIATLPEAMTTSCLIMNFPPVDAVPEFLRGKSFVMVRGAYAGTAAQGAQYIQQWLDWREPVANTYAEMPFSSIAAVSNDPRDPMPSTGSGAWMRDLSDKAIDTIIEYAKPQNAIVFAEVRHIGGAMNRVPREDAAFGNRDAALLLSVVGAAPTPEVAAHSRKMMGELKAALAPSLTGGVYPNFLEGGEARQRVRDAYGDAAFKRLKSIKAKYDPENLFRFSFNITPETK